MKNDSDSLFNKARQLQYEGQLPQAISLYEQIINDKPDHYQALSYAGLAYAQSGDMNQAIVYMQKALHHNPTDPSLYNNLANAYRNIGEYEKAVVHYQKAIQLDSGYAQAHNNLAAVYALQNQYNKALKHYKQAVHAQPDFAAAHFNLGLLLLKHNEFTAAKTQFKNVLALNPAHSEALFLTAVLCLENNQLKEAKDAFQKVLEQNPEQLEAMTNLGVIALKEEKSQQAIDYFSSVLAINNEHIDARNNLASTFMHHDRFENALMHYDVLLQKEPDNVEYHYNSGVAQMALGHLNEAIGHFEHILRLNETHFPALNNLAAIYIRLNDKPKARDMLEKAVAANPEDSASRHMLRALTGRETTNTIYSPEYACNLFDNYAVYYDQHMQGQLNYSVPQHIAKLLHQLQLNALNHCLDLGCGTGLSGIVMRESCQTLTGVDISKKMLAQANEKQIYDQLIEAELIQYLQQNDTRYELIVAADVLPYLGELETLFRVLTPRLTSQGLFVFTAEISIEKPWQLQETARYSHQPEYIQSLCNQFGFTIIHQEQISARLHEQTDLAVILYACRKKNEEI